MLRSIAIVAAWFAFDAVLLLSFATGIALLTLPLFR